MKLVTILLLVPVVAGPLYACTARQTAKTEYEAQSQACVDIYKGDAAGQKSCLDYVRAKWNAAGAPAAATDGGKE